MYIHARMTNLQSKTPYLVIIVHDGLLRLLKLLGNGVEEMAPLRRRAELRDEICIHVLVLIGRHDQSSPLRYACVVNIRCERAQEYEYIKLNVTNTSVSTLPVHFSHVAVSYIRAWVQ